MDELITQVRALAGALGRLNSTAEVFVDTWDAEVSAIVGSLDANTNIPNASGLAGASDLSKEEVTQMLGTSLAGLLTTYNSSAARQIYARFAGPTNLIRS